MSRRIAAMISLIVQVIGLVCLARPGNAASKHVVLPNPDLLLCPSFGCSQLWLDEPAQADAIFPVNISVDVFGANACPRGIVALYGKSVSTEDIQSALDERYGKWAESGNATLPVKLWRVEPARFAIQLATIEKQQQGVALGQALAGQMNKLGHASQVGMKQVIYLAFVGEKCRQ